jgi:hypothetical protein
MPSVSGWLGRFSRRGPWHRLLDGGDRALCGEGGSVVGEDQTMDSHFKHDDEAGAQPRCDRCERLYAEGKRSR